MNNAVKIILHIVEGILILTAIAAAIYYFAGAPQPVKITAPEDSSPGPADSTEDSADISGIKDPEDQMLAPVSSLRRIFFYEQKENDPLPEPAPESAGESNIPDVTYAGMIKLDDDTATYLFTINNNSRPLSFKINKTVNGLKLSGVQKTPGGTLFTFKFEGEEFSISDR